MAARVLLVLLVLALNGCTTVTGTARPSTGAPTDGPTATPRPTASPRPATPAPTPLPLPSLDPTAAQTWFAPNMGSLDYPDLFRTPDRWATARERVDVLQFYANALSGDPFDIGGSNVLDTFVAVDAFARLHEWGIATAIEAGVIKFFACDHDSWAEYAINAITNVEANGGRVSFLAMDEPLLGGQLIENGQTCGYTLEQAAAEVADFGVAVRAVHPDVAIGTIETIPPQTPAEMIAWIEALEAAGARPAFLHLDVEVALGVEDPAFLAGIRQVRDFSEARGIPFGLILTADWQRADSDAGYYASVVDWAKAIEAGMGRPTHVVVQSWIGPAPSGLHEMPINLPDDDPARFSHTRLIVEALDAFGT